MPNNIPSVMINRPMPDFILSSLLQNAPELTPQSLKNKVVLINIFASWCVQCKVEHSVLEEVKSGGIILVGIDYKDSPKAAREWLAKLGNPYDVVGQDSDGHVGIDFGLYGVPESYLVDRQGIIRFKQTGPLTEDIIQSTILPLAKELNK